jgi:putative tryptophan/tyrosine transport system substrate-binding protein
MRRREFITVIGGAAATWPTWPIAAQQSTRPVVALINGGAADALVRQAAAFRKGLGETGYDEEKNVTVEYHLLAGQYALLPDLLDSLIRRRVAVIRTPGSTPAALAAKAATATIPIVFGVGDDPVALGLIANFAKPGGNVTGINFFAFQVTAKRLGLMHELLPKATRFAVLVNPDNAPSTESTSNEIKKAAHDLGVDVLFFNASTSAEIDTAFTAMARERVDAVFIGGDSFFLGRRVQFSTLAIRDKLPASFPAREMVEAGLLMSYGTSLADMFRQVGIYTGSILNGTKPTDLPVLQSTKLEFVINLQTARSLQIEIPPTLLARADEVIE